MKPAATFLIVSGFLAGIAGAGVGGYWLGHRGAPEVGEGATTHEGGEAADAASTQPVATVDTVAATLGPIVQTLDAYGTVISDPANLQTITAPYEGRLSKMLVSVGIPVAADQAVAEIEPSPDSQLALKQAKNAVDAAGRDLENTKERFAMKLATNQELQTSLNGVNDAKVKLDDLQARGIGSRRR